MHLVALKIAYRGQGYHGFQRQPGLPTVEDDLLEVLASSGCLDLGNLSEYMYSAAGRTDKGAHALGQTISLITNCSPTYMTSIINETLNPRIAAWAYRLDPHGEFKAREWCLARLYVYLLPSPPSGNAGKKLKRFLGYRDYSWLTPLESGRNPRRLVYYASILEITGSYLVLIAGESFLKQQVRRMVSYALGLCRSKEQCRPLPPGNLVLLDARYSFSFSVLEGAFKMLEKLAAGIRVLELSLGLLRSIAGHPSYLPCY